MTEPIAVIPIPVTLSAALAASPANESRVGELDENEAVRCLDWSRCVSVDTNGQQCDTWIRVTPKSRSMCAAHNPNAPQPFDEQASKERYMDIINTALADASVMTYDAREQHIAFLSDHIETTKARLFTMKSVSAQELSTMDEVERQKRRRVKVVPSGSQVKRIVGTGRDKDNKEPSPTAQAKTTALNELAKSGKSAAESMAIYNLASKNGITIKQATMLLED